MKTIAIAGLLALSTLVGATEYRTFAGVEITSGEVELNSGRKIGHEPGYGLRAGLMGDDHRVYLNIGQSDTDYGDVRALAINMEGLTSPYVWTSWLATRFFVGGHVGTTEYKDKYDLAYGVQGGLMFGFPANISLEVGGRYSWSQADNVDHAEAAFGAVNFTF